MLRNDDSRKDEGRSSSGTRILETVQNDPVGRTRSTQSLPRISKNAPQEGSHALGGRQFN